MSAALVLVFVSMIIMVVLVCMGLSYISASLGGLYYSDNRKKKMYYSNPLLPMNSIYFHYKPKGSVILTKRMWKEIEMNMAYKIKEAMDKAKEDGYKEALELVERKAKEKSLDDPSTPPESILGVDPHEDEANIRKRYEKLMSLYAESNFNGLHDSFVRLAALHRNRIAKAYTKLTFGSRIK